MSSHSSQDRSVTIGDAEVLAIIREEHSSNNSSINITSPAAVEYKEPVQDVVPSLTKHHQNQNILGSEEFEKILTEREAILKHKFDEQLEKEIEYLKERFDYILQNEQIRASYMLREAHRERQEKISALQTQLECKNLAGLMYVLCSERRKCKHEKLKIIEEFTNYIMELQSILRDGQAVILDLSRGYKTAARVDHEWREKMKKVMEQNFIHHYAGGTKDENQYFIDLPKLLKTSAPIEPNLNEDPCQIENLEEEEEEEDLESQIEEWWGKLGDDNRPFVVFGDMAEFSAPQRREVLRTVKATKTAPPVWKEYIFNEMALRTACQNATLIKNVYPQTSAPLDKWNTHMGVQTQDMSASVHSSSSRRNTTTSVDVRGNMGSLLKIITASTTVHPGTRANILGARDSLEIASTTKLMQKDKRRESDIISETTTINVGNRKASMFHEVLEHIKTEDKPPRISEAAARKPSIMRKEEKDDEVGSKSLLGSNHNDSLQVMQEHVPDRDATINFEKVCPMDKCKRMQVDSFMRSLPAYMRASPFLHFEQTCEQYETCTPEQIEILKQRIEEKKKRTTEHEKLDPLVEWEPSVEGIGIQTSVESLPPCTCMGPYPTPECSAIRIFNMSDLVKVKKNIDDIKKDCFFDDNIEFDRFKVLGEIISSECQSCKKEEESAGDFKQHRIHDIKKILTRYPSLCSIFQGNTVP